MSRSTPNADTLAGTGTLSAVISGTTIPLLNGGLSTTSIVSWVNSGLSTLSGATITVAGTTFTLDSIQLNSSGPEIQLQGSIAFAQSHRADGQSRRQQRLEHQRLRGEPDGRRSLPERLVHRRRRDIRRDESRRRYTAATQTFAITGNTSITAGKLGTVGVDLGGGSTQGVVITNGALTSLDATASLNATLGGGTFSATGINLTYESPSDFLISGAPDLKFGSDFDLSLTLGTPAVRDWISRTVAWKACRLGHREQRHPGRRSFLGHWPRPDLQGGVRFVRRLRYGQPHADQWLRPQFSPWAPSPTPAWSSTMVR